MQRIFEDEDFSETDESIAAINRYRLFRLAEIRASIYGAAGIKNPPSRNKPLAQGKPAVSRAKGKPSKAGKPPRKGTGKK